MSKVTRNSKNRTIKSKHDGERKGSENLVPKAKKILLRVSDPLYKGIERAIELGIADNASEFVRRCVVNQLLDLQLLGKDEKKDNSSD